MNAHVYRLTAEFNHERGMTPEERLELIKKVQTQLAGVAWSTGIKIEYIDYLPVDDR